MAPKPMDPTQEALSAPPPTRDSSARVPSSPDPRRATSLGEASLRGSGCKRVSARSEPQASGVDETESHPDDPDPREPRSPAKPLAPLQVGAQRVGLAEEPALAEGDAEPAESRELL